jgi:hypothetical protein
VAFPGRSGLSGRERHGAVTTSDWAEEVIARLRELEDVSARFWNQCSLEPSKRQQYEAAAQSAYNRARNAAWEAVDRFADSAAKDLRR